MSETNKNSFVKGRIRSVKFAAKGAWILVTQEHSIIAQVIIGLVVTAIGFFVGLTPTEWLFQTFAIGLVIVAESANTAIEYLCDYIQPNFDKRIGKIKDIGAGASFLAAVFALITALVIYIPKFT